MRNWGITPPKTFEELISSCSVLKSAGYEPIAFGNKDGWPALHYLQQLFAYEVPTDVLKADFHPATAKLEDAGYLKAMKQFSTLVNECTGSGKDSNGVLYTTAQQALAEGKAGMYYQEILEFDTTASKDSSLKKDGLGIFRLPAAAGAKGDTEAIEASPEGYIINAKSKNAALAADFMKFATSTQNAAKLSAPPYGQPSSVRGRRFRAKLHGTGGGRHQTGERGLGRHRLAGLCHGPHRRRRVAGRRRSADRRRPESRTGTRFGSVRFRRCQVTGAAMTVSNTAWKPAAPPSTVAVPGRPSDQPTREPARSVGGTLSGSRPPFCS